MRADALEGNGANTRIRGAWLDPSTQPPLKGLSVSSTTTITGPVTYALFR
jgi:hypothetical protein